MKIKRLIKKIAVDTLIVMMALPSPSMVLAQEATPEASPTQTQENLSPTPNDSSPSPTINETTPTPETTPGENMAATLTPEPTSGMGENVVQTGEAQSNNGTNNTANLNETTTPESGGVVDSNNTSTTDTSNTSEANTGTNQSSSNEGNITIETGQAAAYANVLNLINTNLTNSNLKILIVNNFDGNIDALDLNKIWQEAKTNPSDPFLQNGNKILIVSNHSLAKVSNKVNVLANSGNNGASTSGDVLIISGDAVAIANVVNLINVNLTEAQLFLGIVNIDGNNFGDLILPNPEALAGNGQASVSPLATNISNEAKISDQLNTDAQTGNNNETNSNVGYIQSGNAIAGTNNFTAANETYINQNETLLVVNILGSSDGNIYNRLYPGSVESMEGLNQIVYYRNDGQSKGQIVGLIYNSQNQAELQNDITVKANSGGNGIESGMDATILSGNAIAWANLANLVNLNMLGGNRFISFVNIFGNWKGNIVFAYPDLAVRIDGDRNEVVAGEQMDYIVTFDNIGYDDANGVKVELDLPSSMDYISDNSGIPASVEGQKISWSFDKLKSKESKSLVIRVGTNSNYEMAQNQDRGLVKSVMAADNYKTKDFKILAVVAAGQNESNNQNNTDGVDTTLLYPEGKGDVDAKLEVEVKNNVNEYVLPNDVVTFEVNLKNSGEGDIHNARLFHDVYDENGELFSTDSIYIGDIRQSQTGKISFGIPMKKALGGKYTSVTIIKGTDQVDDGVDSNEATTSFNVKGSRMVLNTSTEVQAQENNVLGIQKEMTTTKGPDRNLFLYLLLMVSSGGFLTIEAIKKYRLLIQA